MTYTPMPNHLDHLLQKLVTEAGSSSTSASNTVFVFREALGQAYAMGHKDGHTQASSQQWLIGELQDTIDSQAAKTKEGHSV